MKKHCFGCKKMNHILQRKKILIVIIAVLLLVLFLPIPKGTYDDGGTRDYCALTYRIVVWNKLIVEVNEDGSAGEVNRDQISSVFWFPDNFKSIDELWKIERAAQNGSDKRVYASTSEQDDIYEMITNDGYDGYAYVKYNNYQYVKESITPVYTFDVREFALKGTIALEPLLKKRSVAGKEETGSVYVVKYVDKDKTFRGNEFFVVTSSGAVFLRDEIVSDDPDISNPVSCSYADHADRIKKALNADRFILVTDVRFVTVEGIGDYFYVSNKGNNGFFSIGYETEENKKASDTGATDIGMIPVSVLQEYADLYVQRFEENQKKAEEYLKEHPREVVLGDIGYLGSICPCSGVMNIYNINEYLAENEGKGDIVFPMVVIGSVVLITILSAIILLNFKKKNGYGEC